MCAAKADDSLAVRPLLIGLPGPVLDAATREMIARLQPAGFILFARNCESPAQLQNLTSALADLSVLPQPLILIDHEGGRVTRFQWDDYIPPAAQVFGELWRENPEQAVRAAQLNGMILGWQVAQYGLTVNCAPVADLAIAGADAVIGERTFSDDPEAVGALAGATMAGLTRGGVLPILKHAPGHGRARADSHKSLPVIETPLSKLEITDFVPFKALAQAPLVMTAHVVLPESTGDQPVTWHQAGIKLLREELGLSGLLVADDLWMGALTGPLRERAQKALLAGCDLLIVGSGRLDGQFDIERWQELATLEAIEPVQSQFFSALKVRPLPIATEIAAAKNELQHYFFA